jgi:hypothetical protein
MKRGLFVFCVGSAWMLVAGRLHAEPPKIELGTSLGGALPYGRLEAGSRLSDTGYGRATLGVDGAYRYAPGVSLLAAFRYGVAIPKLCASAEDCRASLGSDVMIAFGSRLHPPPIGPLRPFVDLGFGYEWYTTRLSDQGIASSRSYHGPVLLMGRLGGDFRLSRVFRLGPFFGLSVAEASHVTLDAPGFHESARTAGPGLHGFVEIAARLAARF